MGTMQDLMCYQINKFHRTSTLHPPSSKPSSAPASVPPQSQSQPPSPTIKASTPNQPENLKTSCSSSGISSTDSNKLKTACSCKCQSSNKEDSGCLELIQCYYCPDCERETKKSRTLRFGSGGDVFVDKSHHTYYNTLPPPRLAPATVPATVAENSGRTTCADAKSSCTDQVHVKPNAKNEDSSSTLTVSINLPTTFDFKLLANQSHHLRVNISICENKNSSSRRALASLPSSPSATTRNGNNGSTHSFTFMNGHMHTSSSCGHINELNTDCTKHDIRHNLQLSGWYYGKMDWQDSIRVLKSTPIGTFLLRDSGDRNYCFSLSMQTEHGPISSRISYRNGKFRLDSQDHVSDMLPSFTNIISLIEHYIKFGLVKNPSGRQVWVDSHGLTFSPIHLKEPKRKFVPSLQHMSRLVINRNLDRIDIGRRDVPPTIQNYLNKYPHTV